MARMIRSTVSAPVLQSTAEDEARMARTKAEAEAKMAVVDALSAKNRAKVHAIGYRGFKHSGPVAMAAYKRAKAAAGVGATHKTQTGKVARILAAPTASAVENTY